MIERVGVMDVVSISAQQDAIIVFPTLLHAHALWPRYRDAIKDRHDENTKQTKTGIVMPSTRTELRMWVPYTRAPTMWMDAPQHRVGKILISPYTKLDCRLY